MTKDKELIERLAHELEGEYLSSTEPLSLSWIAEQAIARYLAERGKEAVAWHTEDHLTDKSATTYDREVSERWKAKGWPVTPLFLAPQIPEGYKLVPIEPTKAMLEAGVIGNPTSWAEWTDRGFPESVANDVYRSMIAAAGVQP